MKHTSLTDFYGVDMTGTQPAKHAAHMFNLYRRGRQEADTEEMGEGDALATLPGFRRVATASSTVYSLFPSPDGNALYIHAGNHLYRLPMADVPALPHGSSLNELLSSIMATRNLMTNASALSLRIGPEDSTVRTYSFLPAKKILHTTLGNDIYLLCPDERRLFCLNEEGVRLVAEKNTVTIGGAFAADLLPPYIPLLTKNGAPCQQRNLLTDRYRESRILSAATLSLEGNAPLTYTVNDPDADIPSCTVTGMLTYDYTGPLVIPPFTKINGTMCQVTKVDGGALANGSFTEIYFPYTMRKIGATPLRGCTQVHTVHIPIGVEEIYMSAFNECASNLLVRYEGTAAQWNQLSVYEDTYIHDYDLRCAAFLPRVTYHVPLALPALSVEECLLDGQALGANLPTDAVHMVPIKKKNESHYTGILLIVSSRLNIEGKELTLCAKAAPFSYADDSPMYAREVSGSRLPLSADCLCAYDNRLFFGGGLIKDALFFTGDDENGNPHCGYIGVYNYETDSARLPVTHMCQGDGDLLVCHGDGTRGKLVARRGALPAEEDRALFPRTYPSVAECNTEADARLAFLHRGRLHLLSGQGLHTYSRRTDGGYFRCTSVGTRIRPALEAAAKAELTACAATLEGQLALYVGDTLYIGDGDGGGEYDWYPAKGVCCYRNDSSHEFPVDHMPDSLRGLLVCPNNGTSFFPLTAPNTKGMTQLKHEMVPLYRTEGRVTTHTGQYAYVFTFADKQGKRHYVPADCCGVFSGGTPSPVTCMTNVKECLFFGTRMGAVCLFNTDEGGRDTDTTPPDSRYLFDRHSRSSGLTTFPIDCGLPAEKKRTVAGSAFCLLGAHSRLICRCHADGRQVMDCTLSADVFDLRRLYFPTLSFHTARPEPCPMPEGTLTFREKSYSLYSDAPFTLKGLKFSWERVK